ncbi:ABC transporter substrate-binding protein [Peptostreptococcaceae bacterium OttesenSCG-928-C18]|nr:ABC transporter substrate-binding protein [Peptostreptococcaceae bacterium OttesenSCG-928-C18]
MKKIKTILLAMLCLILVACNANTSINTDLEQINFEKSKNEFIKRASFQSKLDNTLSFALVGEPSNLNPFYYNDNSSKIIVNTLYSPLFRLKEENFEISYEFELLDGLIISDDSLIYTLSLKKDTFWHDGSNLTINDLIFSINYAINNKDTRYLDSFYIDDRPVELEKVDEYTLNIKLPRASSSFIYVLSDLLVVPEHIFSNNVPNIFTYDEEKYLIGNSAYKFKENSVNKDFNTNEINFIANENYYKEKAIIENLKYRVVAHKTSTRYDLVDYNLQGGYLLNTDVAAFRNELYNIRNLNEGKVISLLFKTNTKNGSNAELRKAVSNIISPYSLLGHFGDNTNTSVANSVFGQNNIYRVNNPILNTASAGEAIEYLKELQLEDKDFSLRYGFIYNPGEAQEKIAVYLQEMFIANGLNLELVPLSEEEYEDFLKDNNQEKIDFCIYKYDTNKNPNYYKNIFMKDSPLNYSGYSNKDLDTLWSKADSTINFLERVKIYNEIQNILLDERPVFPLLYENTTLAVDDRIENIDLAVANSVSFFNNLNLLSIKEFSYTEKDLEKFDLNKNDIERKPSYDAVNTKIDE